jgi:ethanolamine utilization protein EutN
MRFGDRLRTSIVLDPGTETILVPAMLLQPLVAQQRTLVPSGTSVVAIDTLGAGLDEFVMFTQGSSARLAAQTKDTPVDAIIVGIVDHVKVDGTDLERP